MMVSVITVVKNANSTILDTIASVGRQSHADVEHLVVDGGSTDGTVDAILEAGFPRERLFAHPDNGVYQGFNRGLAAASGAVVGFLNGDDVFEHDDVLSLIVERFKTEQCNAVYGDLVYVQRGDLSRVLRYWSSGRANVARVRRGWMVPHPTFYVSRELADRLGPYDERFMISGDYEYFLRMIQTGCVKLCYIPAVLVRMRSGGISNWPPRHHLLKWKEDLMALRLHGVGDFPTLIAKNLRKIPQAFRSVSMSNVYYRHGIENKWSW